jgi:hypothetical protein
MCCKTATVNTALRLADREAKKAIFCELLLSLEDIRSFVVSKLLNNHVYRWYVQSFAGHQC